MLYTCLKLFWTMSGSCIVHRESQIENFLSGEREILSCHINAKKNNIYTVFKHFRLMKLYKYVMNEHQL